MLLYDRVDKSKWVEGSGAGSRLGMSRTRHSTLVDLRCAVDLRGVQADAARRVPSPAVLHWIYPAHPPVPIAITRRTWRRPSTHGCDGQTEVMDQCVQELERQSLAGAIIGGLAADALDACHLCVRD